MRDSESRLEELHRELATFNLPDYRKVSSTIHGLRWLARNLAVRNSSHPRLEQAMTLVKEELREQHGIKDP